MDLSGRWWAQTLSSPLWVKTKMQEQVPAKILKETRNDCPKKAFKSTHHSEPLPPLSLSLSLFDHPINFRAGTWRKGPMTIQHQFVYSAIEFVYSAIEFVYNAIEFVYSAIEFVYSAIEFVYSAIEFVYSAIEVIEHFTSYMYTQWKLKRPYLKISQKLSFCKICTSLRMWRKQKSESLQKRKKTAVASAPFLTVWLVKKASAQFCSCCTSKVSKQK